MDAFCRGDTDAPETVYYAYIDSVANIVRFGVQLSDGRRVARVWTDEASEIVQETFVRAFSETARRGYDGLRLLALSVDDSSKSDDR